MNPESPPPAPPGERQRPSLRSRKGCAVLVVVVFLLVVVAPQMLNNHLWRRSRALEEKAVMKGLEIAIRGFKAEYLTLPHVGPTPPTKDNEPFETTDANGRALLDVLLARNASVNRREILFWEPLRSKPNGSGYAPETGLVDSRGKRGYRVILDYDKDGMIANPAAGQSDGEPDVVSGDVILYSAGPDGDFSTWKDNVRSWK